MRTTTLPAPRFTHGYRPSAPTPAPIGSKRWKRLRLDALVRVHKSSTRSGCGSLRGLARNIVRNANFTINHHRTKTL